MHIHEYRICVFTYYIMLEIPLADPSMRIISTVISLDASLLNVTNAASELLLSTTKYCDWLNDITASVRVIHF